VGSPTTRTVETLSAADAKSRAVTCRSSPFLDALIACMPPHVPARGRRCGANTTAESAVFAKKIVSRITRNDTCSQKHRRLRMQL